MPFISIAPGQSKTAGNVRIVNTSRYSQKLLVESLDESQRIEVRDERESPKKPLEKRQRFR